jgi:hypothetical protein
VHRLAIHLVGQHGRVTDTVRSIAAEYWEAKLEASPLFASFLGDHGYDDRADDLSADAERRLRSVWVGLRKRAAAVDGGSVVVRDATDRASRDLLVRELDDTCGRSTSGSPS